MAFALILLAVCVTVWPASPNTEPPRPPVLARVVGSVVPALGAALLLSLAVAAGVSLVQKARELALVGRSLAGAPPEDGRRVAACGTLVLQAPPLTAPLSGRPCAAYHYQIRHTPSGSKSSYTDCWGYALAPSVVETAAGVIRILGYTDFDFKHEVMDGPEPRERARRHAAASTFVTMGRGSLATAWSAFTQLMADDDGAIRADFGPPPADLGDPKFVFEEQAVEDREAVCAIGTYAADRGGLVPVRGGWDVFPVRLIKGDGDAVRRKLLRVVVGQAVLGILLAGAAAGVVYVFLRFAPTM